MAITATTKEKLMDCPHQVVHCDAAQKTEGVAVCNSEECGEDIMIASVDENTIQEFDGARRWKRRFDSIKSSTVLTKTVTRIEGRGRSSRAVVRQESPSGLRIGSPLFDLVAPVDSIADTDGH